MHAIHVPVLPVCKMGTTPVITGCEIYTCSKVQFIHDKKQSRVVCFVLVEAFLLTASEQVSRAVVRVFVKSLFHEITLQYLNGMSGCCVHYCRFYCLLKIASTMFSSSLLSSGKHGACILSRITTFSERLKSLRTGILQCTAAYTCSNHVYMYSTYLDQ